MDMRFGIDFAKTQLISLLKHLKKRLLQFRDVTDPIQEDNPAPLDDDPGIAQTALDHDNSGSPEDR